MAPQGAQELPSTQAKPFPMISQTSAPGSRHRGREPPVRRWSLEAEKGAVTASRTRAVGRHVRRAARCVSPRPHPPSPAPPGDFFARVTPGWDVRSSERPVLRCYVRLPFTFHPKRTPRSVSAGLAAAQRRHLAAASAERAAGGKMAPAGARADGQSKTVCEGGSGNGPGTKE